MSVNRPVPAAASLRDALIDRWFDPEDTDPAEVTDEQILARIEDLVGEGWHCAGVESERLAKTLRAVNDNALAWHSGEDGKARALNVIAVWTSEALAGRVHPSVETLEEARRVLA